MRRAITPSLEQSVLALLDTSRSNASRLRASEAIVAAPQALLSPWVAPWGSNLIAQSVEDMFSPDAVLGAAQARVLLCVLRLGATSTAQLAAFLRRMAAHIVLSPPANVSRSHDLFFLVLAQVTSPRASLFDEEAGRGGGGAGGAGGGGEVDNAANNMVPKPSSSSTPPPQPPPAVPPPALAAAKSDPPRGGGGTSSSRGAFIVRQLMKEQATLFHFALRVALAAPSDPSAVAGRGGGEGGAGGGGMMAESFLGRHSPHQHVRPGDSARGRAAAMAVVVHVVDQCGEELFQSRQGAMVALEGYKGQMVRELCSSRGGGSSGGGAAMGGGGGGALSGNMRGSSSHIGIQGDFDVPNNSLRVALLALIVALSRCPHGSSRQALAIAMISGLHPVSLAHGLVQLINDGTADHVGSLAPYATQCCIEMASRVPGAIRILVDTSITGVCIDAIGRANENACPDVFVCGVAPSLRLQMPTHDRRGGSSSLPPPMLQLHCRASSLLRLLEVISRDPLCQAEERALQTLSSQEEILKLMDRECGLAVRPRGGDLYIDAAHDQTGGDRGRGEGSWQSRHPDRVMTVIRALRCMISRPMAAAVPGLVGTLIQVRLCSLRSMLLVCVFKYHWYEISG